MAKPPILTLSEITLTFGGDPLLQGAGFTLGEGDRLCLVGRNGSGKSTLLRIAAGLTAPDAGERFVQPGARVAYLPQEPDLSGYATLGDYAAAELEDSERYRMERAMDGLRVDPATPAGPASGGEKRRAALARMLAGEPDVMLLDEPTNHLDVTAIEWLEETLLAGRAGFVVISHDRAFLTRITRGTLWVDRGQVRSEPRGFAAFEEWRDRAFAEEDQALHKLDRAIRREEHWVTHGVSGRRKRNVRRMAELEAMRARRRTHLKRAGTAAMALEAGEGSGKLAIEATDIAKHFGERTILSGFSTRIMRGDRVALVGPNGAGKSTLAKLLIGALAPDSGAVRLGTNLRIATLDQGRSLDERKTLWETLTGDDLLGVKGSNDQVLVRGRPKHVVGYLKEFLFDERQARGPVSALSGGERARLLLAGIMARESNLLVLDEPTNDLDLETLDLLQELLSEYDGTLILVSHDRDFIDRIATTTIVMEGDGTAIEYAGGWSDARAQKAGGATPPAPEPKTPQGAAPKAPAARPNTPKKTPKKLSFKQARRLDALPGEIETLEADIAKLQEALADPGLYARDPALFQKATTALQERETALEAAEEEWLELEALREALEG